MLEYIKFINVDDIQIIIKYFTVSYAHCYWYKTEMDKKVIHSFSVFLKECSNYIVDMYIFDIDKSC